MADSNNSNVVTKPIMLNETGIDIVAALVEISKGNNVLLKNEMQKKFEAFENIIYKWRKIKGDGNCFYRAIIFRYLELIILNNDIDKMEELIKKVKCCYSTPEIISIIENNITANTIDKYSFSDLEAMLKALNTLIENANYLAECEKRHMEEVYEVLEFCSCSFLGMYY